MPGAIADGINRTMRAVEQTELNALERDIDRPTPFTFNALAIRKANARHLDATLFVRPIQAEYLAALIEGGSIGTVLTPTKRIRLNRYGNIPGKRKGLEGIAARGKRRFVGEVSGTFGVWERYGRGGRKLRLLVSVRKDQARQKQWDFYGIGLRVIRDRLARDVAAAIREAARR